MIVVKSFNVPSNRYYITGIKTKKKHINISENLYNRHTFCEVEKLFFFFFYKFLFIWIISNNFWSKQIPFRNRALDQMMYRFHLAANRLPMRVDLIFSFSHFSPEHQNPSIVIHSETVLIEENRSTPVCFFFFLSYLYLMFSLKQFWIK